MGEMGEVDEVGIAVGVAVGVAVCALGRGQLGAPTRVCVHELHVSDFGVHKAPT